MKTFELIIDNPETDEVVALSLVEFPAIEADWVYFNKEEIKFATVDTDKKIIIAPVLIPEKRILRLSGDGEQYQVYLSADTIEKLAQNYINKGYQQNATLEHNDRIDGDISVVESWVSKSREKDKSALYFDRSFPAGTWFVSMKVNSDDLWNDYVKTGKIKAISIEGFFEHKLVQASKQLPISFKNVDEFNEEEAEMFLSKIKQLFESYADYGDDIKNNAKRGIELNEKNNNKCATQTGKVRAQQLANGEAISVDTIQRMYSYLSRAETYYDNADSENDCGHISFMLWGGKSALSWSKNKLEELGVIELETAVSVSSTYAGGFGTGSVDMEIQPPNINVFGYHTRYFHMCQGAQDLFNHLITMTVNEDTVGMIRSAAQVADNVFRKEEEVIKADTASMHDYEEVMLLVDDFKDIMHEIDEEVGMPHDVSFMDMHVEKVKSYLKE
jgi:hypothetical protein